MQTLRAMMVTPPLLPFVLSFIFFLMKGPAVYFLENYDFVISRFFFCNLFSVLKPEDQNQVA